MQFRNNSNEHVWIMIGGLVKAGFSPSEFRGKVPQNRLGNAGTLYSHIQVRVNK